MRTIALGTGSVADQINAVAIAIQQCRDRAELEWRWKRIISAVEAIVGRQERARARRITLVGIDGPLAWLDQVVRDHPGLAEPGAEPLADELLGLILRMESMSARRPRMGP